MAHKATVRSFLQINKMNDIVQGQANANPAPTYVLLPLLFDSFERGFQTEDEISDDDVNSGSPWLTQVDLNFGHPTLKAEVWPNVSELHHLLGWWSQKIPTGNPYATVYPVVPADTDVTTTRQLIFSNGDTQWKAHGIMPNLEIKFGRKGKLTASMDIPLINKASDATTKAAREVPLASSMYRRHLSITAFGGVSSVSEMTLKLSRGFSAVPPDFAAASYATAGFDVNGLYTVEISASGYSGGAFDPSTLQEANTPVDFSTGLTFNDGTKSFVLALGNVKLSSIGDGSIDGSRSWTIEGKNIFKSGGYFISFPQFTPYP